MKIEGLDILAVPGSSLTADAATETISWQKFGVEGMTCGSCVLHVEHALLDVAGVSSARVALTGNTVDVAYVADPVAFPVLQEAVRAAGYDLSELPARNDTTNRPSGFWARIPWLPLGTGIAAALALAGFYIGVVGFAQDFEHALGLVTGDWYFVVPIVLGFGTQVGLFVYARTRLRQRLGARSTKLLGGAGTGTSTVSMIACCAHHLSDVLPVIGLSGAALFLNDYRGPLMALGILSNAAGIAWMVRMIKKSNQCMVTAGKSLPEAAG